MTEPKLTTVKTFAEQGILTRRTAYLGDRTVETPAVAHPARKRHIQEDLHQDSRGISELYQQIDGLDIDQAIHSGDGGEIASTFKSQLQKVPDDEARITFFDYVGSSTLAPAHARQLVEIQADYSDVITVPMMPRFVDYVGEDLSDPVYGSLKKGIATFLHAVEECGTDKSVMGLIPRLSWEFIDDLLELYEAHDVRAFAFDFHRCKVTARTQREMIEPLMESLSRQDIQEYALFYAINLHPGFENEQGIRPGQDFASFGMGFDIIGGQHRSPNGDKDSFKDFGSDELEFRQFERSGLFRHDVPAHDVEQQFPTETGFNDTRVATRLRRMGEGEKYRLQKIVNAEQMALAAADLRESLEDGEGYADLISKRGIDVQAQQAFQAVRERFDAAQEQKELAEFS